MPTDPTATAPKGDQDRVTDSAARRWLTSFGDWCWEHPEVYWGSFIGVIVGIAVAVVVL